MKKITLTLVFALFAICSAFAQGRFSVGPELSLPTGKFSDGADVGFGAYARYESAISEKLNWMASLSYLSYGIKKTSYNLALIPVQAGVKYYFTESFNGFYASGELGLTISNSNVPNSEGDTNFSFAPGIGYHLANVDISTRYQVVTSKNDDATVFGIRVGYVFGGKK